MSITDNNKRMVDGWLGNPSLFPQVEEPPENLLKFSGTALARQIFLASLVAVSVLFFGAAMLSQNLSAAVQSKQDLMDTVLDINARYFEDLLELDPALSIDLSEFRERAFEMKPVRNVTLYLYSLEGDQLLSVPRPDIQIEGKEPEDAVGSGLLARMILWMSRIGGRLEPTDQDDFRAKLIQDVTIGQTAELSANLQNGLFVIGKARLISRFGQPAGILVTQVDPGHFETVLRDQRFWITILYGVSIIIGATLSFIVARTISTPLNDLARAAEIGKSKQPRGADIERVLIPDFVHREDAIGRLSLAMKDMISALYDRIDTNEQFAADVVHEIKNPLASMRSALETLRYAKGDARSKLLDVLVQDVQRLDRMVSDISNASRLDAELVNEQTEEFDLCTMLSRIVDFHRVEAEEKGIELIFEPPRNPIFFEGLEERLAQVFVNLLSNAISFCEEGDAIRVWARVRNSRILAVVEDTGPGIPEESLENIFKRFYSQRAEDFFGSHSGLGLAISKQIVEAHGGIIWAENIRKPLAEDISLEPIGARFVVGLPK